MVTFNDKDISFGNYTRFLKNKDNIIIINGCSGSRD